MQGDKCIHEASYIPSKLDLGWREALCHSLVFYVKGTALVLVLL